MGNEGGLCGRIGALGIDCSSLSFKEQAEVVGSARYPNLRQVHLM